MDGIKIRWLTSVDSVGYLGVWAGLCIRLEVGSMAFYSPWCKSSCEGVKCGLTESEPRGC